MKKQLLIILLIVLILECTLFNVNSYRVLSNNSKREYTKDDFKTFSNTNNETYIEIENINTQIKTIHIELDTILEDVDYQVSYTDETSSGLRDLPRKRYLPEYENSKYMPLYLSGQSKTIGIKVFSSLPSIEKVTINEKIPFNFNVKRVVVLFAIITFIYLLKTREIFRIPFSQKNFTQELVLISIVCVFILITSLINQYSTNEAEKEDFYSVEFVNALAKGQVHLEDKPSEKLMNLKNPYDGRRTR